MNAVYPILSLLLSLFVLSACSPDSITIEEHSEDTKTQLLALETAVNLKNEQLQEEPVYRQQYADKIGVELTQPSHSNYAVNGMLHVEGTIERKEKLSADYAWIQIRFFDENYSSPLDGTQDHYVPLKDGAFKLETQLFRGEGEYRVTISLPANDRPDEYYYEALNFTVFNVNPRQQREITYTPQAIQADLKILEPGSGLISGSKTLTLKGSVNSDQFSVPDLLFELRKDDYHSLHYASVENGEFSIEIPLWFGKGIHELLVSLPNDDYYEIGSVLYVDSTDDKGIQTIQKSSVFDEYGITLNSPQKGGEPADLSYRISGTIGKPKPASDEIPNLFVTVTKGVDSASSVIPITDFQFDDEIYLRFGPGIYTVNVLLPDIENSNTTTTSYFEIAQFVVENTAAGDQRDLLPSVSIQSDAPEIESLVDNLITDGMSDLEKARAIYEYTARNISYDVNKSLNVGNEWDDSALKTLELKTGICVDYSYLAIALLRAAGLEARYIVGTAGPELNAENHAWVEVKVDRKWLTMDPTWGAGYVQNDEFVPAYTEDYFDPSPEKFKTHTRGSVQY